MVARRHQARDHARVKDAKVDAGECGRLAPAAHRVCVFLCRHDLDRLPEDRHYREWPRRSAVGHVQSTAPAAKFLLENCEGNAPLNVMSLLRTVCTMTP